MKAMIADILAYSRIGQTEVTREAVPLGEIIAEILDDFEILIAEKGATVQVDPLPEIFCNRGQMRQAFQNLISNALNFSRENVPPYVHIAYEQMPGSGVFTIIITDNGIGFSEQYKEKIFSLFQRLNTKDQFEGSGIGLAVTRKIIANQHGSISAKSEEGKGSEFRIELPIRKLAPVAGA
jgi:two-component system CheB/CheR fusion protein